jgi:hypothetical protein
MEDNELQLPIDEAKLHPMERFIGSYQMESE